MTAPPFVYYGGKTNLADRIVDALPPHEHYVEPFAGSLSVLLAKPRSTMETVNDLDGDLMTFWRVLRDRTDDLARAVFLTPHSRAEHQAAYESTEDELEKARRVWVLLSQGRGGTLRRTGWRFYRDPAGSTMSMPGYLAGYGARIPPCAERLRGVSLESRDALEVIADYGRHPDVLLYCDPPYLRESRNSTNYLHEMGGEGDHRELLGQLLECRASVVLSAYRSALYDEMLGGWHRVEMSAWTGNGIRGSATRVAGERVEVLWSNRQIGEPHLFSEGTDA